MTIKNLAGAVNSPNLTRKARYYIGLMSGTSADGIDLALVDFNDNNDPLRLVASYYQAYNSTIPDKITALYQPGNNEIDRAFHLDIELAQLFSQAVSALLNQENLTTDDIIAIGSHGQTIRHRPSSDQSNENHPFTLQIGCSQTLATLTGIRVIGQFRRKDMALGGQGAPLVPIFHQQLFAQEDIPHFIVNIGGIANITFLPESGSQKPILGFDTGPGNALLDDWFSQHHSTHDEKFDNNGGWAAKGKVNEALLMHLMQDEYIQLNAPKSTGREYFHLDWMTQQVATFDDKNSLQHSNDEPNLLLEPVDIQATLLAFTVQSICKEIKALATSGKVYLCGGGVHNEALVKALIKALNNDITSSEQHFNVGTMAALGVDGDSLEAMAFAWLAYAFDHKLNSNLPAVTGASSSCCLGNEYLP